MGRRLAARNLIPDAIISSPAVRALTTAEAISAEIGFAAGRIQTDDDLYAAAPRDILDVVSMIGTECRSALIVSHNPALTDLANLFSADYIENVPTCGFLFVSSPAWSEFADGTLEEFDYPKNR